MRIYLCRLPQAPSERILHGPSRASGGALLFVCSLHAFVCCRACRRSRRKRWTRWRLWRRRKTCRSTGRLRQSGWNGSRSTRPTPTMRHSCSARPPTPTPPCARAARPPLHAHGHVHRATPWYELRASHYLDQPFLRCGSIRVPLRSRECTAATHCGALLGAGMLSRG
jgi:hypothetical protein